MFIFDVCILVAPALGASRPPCQRGCFPVPLCDRFAVLSPFSARRGRSAERGARAGQAPRLVGLHRNANGVGVNGEGVKTIKAIKTTKTIQTPKTGMRTRKLSNSYRKTIEKLQFNDLRRIPKKRGAAAERRRPLLLSITLYSLICSISIVFR